MKHILFWFLLFFLKNYERYFCELTASSRRGRHVIIIAVLSDLKSWYVRSRQWAGTRGPFPSPSLSHWRRKPATRCLGCSPRKRWSPRSEGRFGVGSRRREERLCYCRTRQVCPGWHPCPPCLGIPVLSCLEGPDAGPSNWPLLSNAWRNQWLLYEYICLIEVSIKFSSPSNLSRNS